MASFLRILHLYPEHMDLNGDVGNVCALEKRATWRDVRTQILHHRIGDDLPDSVDIVHLGAGTISAQQAIYQDLHHHADTFLSWKKQGTYFLAISSGWHLLGQEVLMLDGEKLAGVGIFKTSTRHTSERYVGEIAISHQTWGTLTGFENHQNKTTLHHHSQALGTVMYGHGNDGKGSEGVIDENAMGVNMHGAFLPMNPQCTDYILSHALRSPTVEVVKTIKVDSYAEKSRVAIVRRLENENR